jgi:aspartate kinase
MFYGKRKQIMKVLKFGGTSVGSAARMQKLLDIINPQERQIVVLSAMSGTTNNLVEIGQAYLTNDKAKAAALIATLKDKYEAVIKELLKKPETLEQGKEVIDYHLGY